MVALISAVILSILAPSLATPAKTKLSGCNLSGVQVPLGSPQGATLPAAVAPLSYLALGVGTQNYTCSAAGTYSAVGAVANIYDVSCLYKTPYFEKLPDLAIKFWSKLPNEWSDKVLTSQLAFSAPHRLGEHFFIPNPITGTGISPVWDFKRTAGSSAVVAAARNSSIPAPTGSQDVDWLYLTSIQGPLASSIYRTHTRLGQPPKTCEVGSAPIQVKYISYYWLVGGTIKQ